MALLFSIGLHNAAVGLFLALLVWVATRIWKSPPVAHLLWLLVLVKLVIPPIVNFDLAKSGSEASTVGTERTTDLSIAGPRSIGESLSPVRLAPQDVAIRDTSPNVGLVERPNIVPSSDPRPALPLADAEPRIATSVAWNAVGPVMMRIWFGGAALIGLLAGFRILRFHRMLSGTLPASHRLQSITAELATRMGLRQAPDVRMVDRAAAPLVWSMGPRATIVIPLPLLGALDERQVAMVLAHELAHLRRRDHWVRIIELVVSVFYWWNPLVWWVRRRLHAVEEQCCDAWVMWVYPDGRRDYAESLFKAAELLPSASSRVALASPFLNAPTLKERIEIVLTNCSPRTASRSAIVCLALLAAVVIPAGVLSLAQDQISNGEGPTKTASPKEPVATQTTISKTPINQPSDRSSITPALPLKNIVDTIPVSEELQPFQGRWQFESYGSLKWPAAVEEARTWQWTIEGREIAWTRPDHETVTLSFAVDPEFTRDRQRRLNHIEFTILDGPDKGATCQGIFYWFTETLWVCIQDPGPRAIRPKKMGFNGYDRQTVIAMNAIQPETGLNESGRQSSTSIPPKAAVAPIQSDAHRKPLATELQALQGAWNFGLCDSVLWSVELNEIRQTWKWVIQDQQITWIRHGKPPVKLAFTVDPSKSPNQINFTYLDGPDKGQKSQGIYEFERDGIWVCMTEPGAKVDRPTQMSMSSTSKTALIILQDRNKNRSLKTAKADAPVETLFAKDATAEIPANREAQIDAAISRLRKLGAFVREFHPRGDPRYWVQVISTGSGMATRKTADNFDDVAMSDVEIIARNVALELHLRNTSVTTAGLRQLASAGRIEMLELTGPNIHDGMLELLPKLPLQGHLGLTSDLLTDVGIQPVAECRQLASVDLSGTLLTDDSLQHLTNLPTLHGVSLGKNFTRRAFAILGRIPGLTKLDASALNPDLNDLKQLPNLRTLSLSGKEYDDESARTIASTFKSLEEAYLRNTSITNAGVQYLSQLKTLKVLTLDGSLIDDGVEESIRTMKQLKWLSVGNCAVGDRTLDAVSEFPDLWHLSLINSQVTDHGVVHLMKLKKTPTLQLAQCKRVTDDSVKFLAQFPDSEGLNLNLQGTGITEKGARQLQAMLPRSQIVWGIPPVPLK